MIEYVVLAASAGIFLLVLAGTGAAVLVRLARSGPRPESRQLSSPRAARDAGISPAPRARILLDAITEVQRDAAATELVKALSDRANNPHIPAFLAAKKTDAPPVPNAP